MIAAALLAIVLQQRSVAITVDDLPINSLLIDAKHDNTITDRLLATFKAYHIPAIGFVNEGKMHGRPHRLAVLKKWVDAGLELGNHSYSHWDLNRTPLEKFEKDVIDGERITNRLLKPVNQKSHYFRHPFLHSGGDKEKKEAFEAFLAKRGYAVAPVTIDNYDFIFARAYERAVIAGKVEEAADIGKRYVEYMDRIFAFHESQSIKILKREPAQTLLIHANLLNADYLDDLGEMMKRRGYRFVSLGEALKDPAYKHADHYFGPSGPTWLHRWAITDGMDRRIFAGEPEVPPDIMRAGN